MAKDVPDRLFAKPVPPLRAGRDVDPQRRPLQFEHLVQINDPRDPRVTPMTRHQLWRGLLLRAEFPRTFVPWLDQCEIERRGDGDLIRTLVFGALVVRDRVTFVPEQRVEYEVIGGEASSSYHLSMQIEEPGPGQLFLRFVYQASSPEHVEGGPLSGAIKEAYRFADTDTVFRIRQLADSGVLDE